jgi:hypothetical protein
VDFSNLKADELLRSSARLPWEEATTVASASDAPSLWISKAQMVVSKAECAAIEGGHLKRECVDAVAYFDHHVQAAEAVLATLGTAEPTLPCLSDGVLLAGGERLEYIEGMRMMVTAVSDLYSSVRTSAVSAWLRCGLLTAHAPSGQLDEALPGDSEACGGAHVVSEASAPPGAEPATQAGGVQGPADEAVATGAPSPQVGGNGGAAADDADSSDSLSTWDGVAEVESAPSDADVAPELFM